MPTRRQTTLLLAASFATAPALGSAQDWPTRPIRLVVPYPPGGNVDNAARLVAGEMQKSLNQAVLVENRAGAGGLLAFEHVARSAPDGYTLYVTANGPLLFSPTIFNRPALHWEKDFVPISTLSFTPLVLQVHPKVPARNAQEFLALAKSRPGGLTMASPGAGTTNHLLSELMQKVTGARWTTVHYKGNAPATTDLLGGQVDFNFDQVSVAYPFVKDGRTRALAVASPRRLKWLPDVPTLEEQGIKGVQGQTFTGVLAPAGTPAPVIARLSAALRQALAEPAVAGRFYGGGSDAAWMSPRDFTAYLKKEEATWLPIIRSAGITAQ